MSTDQQGNNVMSTQVIIPAILIVLVSYSAFFVARTAAPARVALVVISFLAAINFISSQLNSIPKVTRRPVRNI